MNPRILTWYQPVWGEEIVQPQTIVFVTLWQYQPYLATGQTTYPQQLSRKGALQTHGSTS